MKDVYFNPELSKYLADGLGIVIPTFSADLEIARQAAEKPTSEAGRIASQTLREKGYHGVRTVNGVEYLGLPRDISIALREATGEVKSLEHPEFRPLYTSALSRKESWPNVWVAIPKR